MFCGAESKRYKLFWMGGEEILDGIRTFVAEKWVDSVVSVERHSKRVLILKRVVLCGYGKIPTWPIPSGYRYSEIYTRPYPLGTGRVQTLITVPVPV